MSLRSSAAGDPGRLLAGLRQHAAAFDREMSRAALENHKHAFSGHPSYSGNRRSDLGGKSRGLSFWMALAYPAVDQDGARRHPIGVDVVRSEFMENHVHVGAG